IQGTGVSELKKIRSNLEKSTASSVAERELAQNESSLPKDEADEQKTAEPFTSPLVKPQK
ncbi:MAG: hypothetical protein N2Z70_07595, partial [Bdellovibrionaceae bacterium]|nr:hypothetical protein [Pseudobdellovibrionaceae bacterium]